MEGSPRQKKLALVANVTALVTSAVVLVLALWEGVWGGKPVLGWLLVALMTVNVVVQGLLLRANLRRR